MPDLIPDSAPIPPPDTQHPKNTVELRTTSILWRLVAAGVGLIVLSVGQVVNTNDWFPLGSLSQYSYGRPLDTPTKAIRITATTTQGTEVRVPLNPKGVGIGRAELEGQLDRIIENPHMLEGIARAWHGLHPKDPQYTKLVVERTISYVENGKPTGKTDVEFLTSWDVQGNYGGTK